MLERYWFQNMNSQPLRGNEDDPICPNYQTIEICALLVDISEEELQNERQFCGEHQEPLRTSGFDGTKYTAHASCEIIHTKLKDLIILAREDTSLSSEEEMQKIILSTKDTDELEKLLRKHNSKKKRKIRQEKLLVKWRKLVFELNTVPASEKKDIPHFKKFKNAEEIPDERVIRFATSCFVALNNIIGKEEIDFEKTIEDEKIERQEIFVKAIEAASINKEPAALNCEQSPKTHRMGAMID